MLIVDISCLFRRSRNEARRVWIYLAFNRHSSYSRRFGLRSRHEPRSRCRDYCQRKATSLSYRISSFWALKCGTFHEYSSQEIGQISKKMNKTNCSMLTIIVMSKSSSTRGWVISLAASCRPLLVLVLVWVLHCRDPTWWKETLDESCHV